MLSGAVRARRGFTLTELMVATAAMAIVIVYTLGTFAANRNTYVVIDQVSEAHQNALAIASLMERDIRTSGYMTPSGGVLCGMDSTGGPDTIVLTDPDAIRTADQLPSTFAAGDLGSEITSPATVLNWNNTGTQIAITVDDLAVDGELTYDTDATPGADSDFRPTAGILIADRDDPTIGVACGRIESVNLGTRQINLTPISDQNTTPAPTFSGTLVAIPGVIYDVVGSTLERNGALMAHDVEDLQLAWFLDEDGDGQSDAGTEVFGNGNAPNYAAAARDHSFLRELRFNLVIRTQDEDPTDVQQGAFQVAENRAAVAGTDGFRRRVVTSTVRIRNNQI